VLRPTASAHDRVESRHPHTIASNLVIEMALAGRQSLVKLA
jgi:hypothetical protein